MILSFNAPTTAGRLINGGKKKIGTVHKAAPGVNHWTAALAAEVARSSRVPGMISATELVSVLEGLHQSLSLRRSCLSQRQEVASPEPSITQRRLHDIMHDAPLCFDKFDDIFFF